MATKIQIQKWLARKVVGKALYYLHVLYKPA